MRLRPRPVVNAGLGGGGLRLLMRRMSCERGGPRVVAIAPRVGVLLGAARVAGFGCLLACWPRGRCL